MGKGFVYSLLFFFVSSIFQYHHLQETFLEKSYPTPKYQQTPDPLLTPYNPQCQLLYPGTASFLFLPPCLPRSRLNGEFLRAGTIFTILYYIYQLSPPPSRCLTEYLADSESWINSWAMNYLHIAFIIIFGFSFIYLISQ